MGDVRRKLCSMGKRNGQRHRADGRATSGADYVATRNT